jgi:hypothetical protein
MIDRPALAECPIPLRATSPRTPHGFTQDLASSLSVAAIRVPLHPIEPVTPQPPFAPHKEGFRSRVR